MLTRPWHLGHLLLAAMLCALAVIGWRAVGVLRAPAHVAPPFTGPQLADEALLSRTDPFFPDTSTADNLPVTSLPLSLHGVRSDLATGRGSAIIAASDGVQKLFAVGESVASGVTLAAIAADHVILDRGGARETLWLDTAGGSEVQRFDPTLEEQPAEPSEDAAPDASTGTGDQGTAAMPAAPAPEDRN